MSDLTINGKRKWREGKYSYAECYCNGNRIADRCEGQEYEKDMEQRMLNTMKYIKAFGNPPTNTGKIYVTAQDLQNINVPEFDTLPWLQA